MGTLIFEDTRSRDRIWVEKLVHGVLLQGVPHKGTIENKQDCQLCLRPELGTNIISYK